MADYAKKRSTKISSPRKNPSGVSLFAPAKRTYTKSALKLDPGQFGRIGFGDTGLRETPSIIGMARSVGV